MMRCPMIHNEEAVSVGASGASHQPRPVELPAAPLMASTENVPLVVQYMDDETFRRSLEKVASIHERLLAKLAE